MWHCAQNCMLGLEENETDDDEATCLTWPGPPGRDGWSALLSRAQWRGPALAAGHWAVTWLISETQTAAADSCSHHTASRQPGRLRSDLPRMAPGLSQPTDNTNLTQQCSVNGVVISYGIVVMWVSEILSNVGNFLSQIEISVCAHPKIFPDCEIITNSFDKI